MLSHAYPTLLTLHLLTVAISLSLFIARLILQLRNIDWRQCWPWLRWLPHCNDTVLMLAGIGLCALAQSRPWLHGWLAAKLVFLLLYIVVAKLALAANQRLKDRHWMIIASLIAVSGILVMVILKPF